MAYLTDLFIFT